MHNQNGAVLTQRKAGVSVTMLKNYFNGEKILTC